jgi:hypothetical protein
MYRQGSNSIARKFVDSVFDSRENTGARWFWYNISYFRHSLAEADYGSYLPVPARFTCCGLRTASSAESGAGDNSGSARAGHCPVEPRGLSCRRVRRLSTSVEAVIAESSEAGGRESVEKEDIAGPDGLSGEFDDSL